MNTRYLLRFRKKFRSSLSEVFLGKDVMKICTKFTGEHLCRTVISITLQSYDFVSKIVFYFQLVQFSETCLLFSFVRFRFFSQRLCIVQGIPYGEYLVQCLGASLIVLFVSNPGQEARMFIFSENGHFQLFYFFHFRFWAPHILHVPKT